MLSIVFVSYVTAAAFLLPFQCETVAKMKFDAIELKVIRIFYESIVDRSSGINTHFNLIFEDRVYL